MDDLCWTVTDEDVGFRADVVLGRRVPGLSRRIARRMALEGKLRINGRTAPPSRRVASGDELRLLRAVPEEEPFHLEILQITPDFVYVQKPPMMHVHRLRPDDPISLADLVGRIHPECTTASSDPREGGIVHRLDYETTGVVAFARSLEAWTRAREAFRRGSVGKLYLAVCAVAEGAGSTPAFVERIESGHPLGSTTPWGPPLPGLRITAPLERTQHGVEVNPAGTHAKTSVWVLSASTKPEGDQRELVLLSLVTGRRHQARVHLAWIGRPIVGDSAYGGLSSPDPGFLLHAWGLDLSSAGAEESAVWAPVHERFAAALSALGIPPPKPLDPG